MGSVPQPKVLFFLPIPNARGISQHDAVATTAEFKERSCTMARPVTLFTGQWADLPLETMCQKAKDFGYDGLELACWGDHFEVAKATAAYCKAKRELLERYGLKVYAISAHLVGQAVCDRIDERHKAILPDYVWGDGDPEGVRRRAAKEMIATAKPHRPPRTWASRSSTVSPAHPSGTCSTRSRPLLII